MTSEQFTKIEDTIKSTIKETVNGKIDRLKSQLDEYIKNDNEWKANAMPSIETMKKTQNFLSVFIDILKFIGIFGTAFAIIYAAIVYIK